MLVVALCCRTCLLRHERWQHGSLLIHLHGDAAAHQAGATHQRVSTEALTLAYALLQVDMLVLQLVNATAVRFTGGGAALDQWLEKEAVYAASLEQLGGSLLQQYLPSTRTALPPRAPLKLTPLATPGSTEGMAGSSAVASAGDWQGHAAATVLALVAEALMNLSPWEYYELPSGQLKATAARAEQVLLQALSVSPSHPQALHLHVHIAEAGRPGAARLDPLSAGRLVDEIRYKGGGVLDARYDDVYVA